MDAHSTASPRPSLLDRLLRLFSDVRAGEAVTVLLMLFNVFLLLVAYYITKTVREPLILTTGGAQMKSYAAGVQALTLTAFVPLYGWLGARVSRLRLCVFLTLFFVLCLQLFFVGGQLRIPNLGFVFFVWVGIFSLATIAQFWAYANDIYTQESGERLFPVIAIGATLGSPVGAWLAEWLFRQHLDPYTMLQISAGLLLVHLGLYVVINGRVERQGARAARQSAGNLGAEGGFALVLRSPYLRLIALLLIVLNLVNSLGEYLLSNAVVEHADWHLAKDPSFDRKAFIGSFYGGYFFWVNVGAVLLQSFVASRLVKHLGLRGVLLALPVVAFGAYGLIALGAGFTFLRWGKTAENATDYSIMNTAKQLLWLRTSRDEKYKAKQAVDTFFVRLGDMLAAGVVFAATSLKLSLGTIAGVNVLLVVVWLGIAVLLLRAHTRLASPAH
jgi:AAA family ATP:ADP antiporter